MIVRKWVYLLFTILCCMYGNGSSASKILAIFPTETKSHYIMYGTVLRELSKRGHEITVAGHFPEHSDLKMKFVDLRNIFELPMYTIEFLKDMSYIDGIPDIIDYHVNICVNSLNKTSIRELLENKYDLLITEMFGCDCIMSLGYKMNIPTVGIVSSVTLPWTTPVIGHLENPSYISSYFLPYGQKMTFLQRTINSFFSLYGYITYEFSSNRKIQEHIEDAIGPAPPLREISKNLSLILTNSHFSVNHVKPTLPQLVEVGGLHIPDKVPPIPKDLEKFFNESKEGVILFSLGTFTPTETMGEEKMAAVLDVLGSLPYNILWKINGTGLKNLPPNIRISDWVPQLSVLCDPRTKLFIAHGGLLGLQEAMYCGVPMLGIPLFADQYMNLHVLQEKGAALVLYYDDINKETLTSRIHKLLYNERYIKKAKVLSSLFKDRPQHPLQTAVYWIEYVLRHKGTLHLRSPAQDLAWYQYLLLDILLLILIVFHITGYTIYCLFRILKKNFRNSKNIQEKKNS